MLEGTCCCLQAAEAKGEAGEGQLAVPEAAPAAPLVPPPPPSAASWFFSGSGQLRAT